MFNSLATPWTAAYQAPRSMGFPRQEYWSGLPFPSPGDLPLLTHGWNALADPWMEPASPAWQAGSLPLSHPRSLCYVLLRSKTIQPHTDTYRLPFGLPSHSGDRRALFWIEGGETESAGCGGTELEGWTVPGREASVLGFL